MNKALRELDGQRSLETTVCAISSVLQLLPPQQLQHVTLVDFFSQNAHAAGAALHMREEGLARKFTIFDSIVAFQGGFTVPADGLTVSLEPRTFNEAAHALFMSACPPLSKAELKTARQVHTERNRLAKRRGRMPAE